MRACLVSPMEDIRVHVPREQSIWEEGERPVGELVR